MATEQARIRVAAGYRPDALTVLGLCFVGLLVIWLGVKANPELRCLKQDLEYSFGDIGFDAETRAFHPHVTLGRAEEREGAGAFRTLDDMLSALDCKGDAKVATLDLMRSQLGPGGSKYTVVSSAKLAD